MLVTIVISSSIPKSASTLICNYQQDLLALANQNVILAQKKLRHSNCGYLSGIGFKSFLIAIFINRKYGDVVIKTHSKPSFFIKLLIVGLAKATFCYRDPRDVILSAIDHGERTRKGLDSSGAYKNMISIKDSLPIVKNWTRNWYKWKEYGKVFFIRYEDLLRNKRSYLLEMSQYLNLELREEQIEKIYIKHEEIKKSAWNFNKGTIERYKTEMNDSDRLLCNRELKSILEDMKYSI